jgi:hypothetical protein
MRVLGGLLVTLLPLGLAQGLLVQVNRQRVLQVRTSIGKSNGGCPESTTHQTVSYHLCMHLDAGRGRIVATLIRGADLLRRLGVYDESFPSRDRKGA